MHRVAPQRPPIREGIARSAASVDPAQSALPETSNVRVRKQARQGAPHVGRRHAGPRPWLLRSGGGLHLRLRTALKEHDHDLRLFTRRHRLRRAAVLPDLRPAAARAVLNRRKGPVP